MIDHDRERLYAEIETSDKLHRELIARIDRGEMVTAQEWVELRLLAEQLLEHTQRHVHEAHMPKTQLPDDFIDKGNATAPDLDEHSMAKNLDNEPAANDGGAPSSAGRSEQNGEERRKPKREKDPGFV